MSRRKNTRKLWLSLGALWAVIALTNPALLSIMPFTFLYAAFVNHRSFRPWFASAVLAGVLFTALVAPWLIRNERVFGRPVFFRSNFWFEFHLGNYHSSNGMGFSGKHPGANPAVLKNMRPWRAGFPRLLQERRPAFCPRVSFRISRPVAPPHLVVLGWHIAALSGQGMVAALGILAAVSRRLARASFRFDAAPARWLLFAAALLVYPVAYYFVYPVAKYRHAIEPELLLLSVYFVFVLWSEIRALAHRKT